MTAYRYRALNLKGKLVRGVLEGDSERQVRGQLRGQDLRPVEVLEANKAAAGSSSLRSIQLFALKMRAGCLNLSGKVAVRL